MAAEKPPESVGYKRPPIRTRFRPGQSGNPSGRPKRLPSLQDDLEFELAQPKRVERGSKEQKVTRQRALMKAVVDSAIDGTCALLEW